MKCLLVIAHPLTESLCQALAREAHAALVARGHEVAIADLYKDDFAPMLSAAERRSYYGEREAVGPDGALLLDAEILVLVFPTWWFGFPAILKGWFDRVWSPGVAFDNAPDGKAILPRLKGLRHAVAITTLGPPRWVDWLVLRQPVKRILKRAIMSTCAPQARFHYLALHRAEKIDAGAFARFAARIRKVCGNL